jgi:hypothetical protein
VARFAPAALVAALLVATAAAFAYAERLKLTPSPILGTQVPVKLFSPTCDCDTATTHILFRLRRRDRVTVTIINGDGDVVRTLVTDQPRPRSRVVDVIWNGLDDAGEVLPDGTYRPRVKLALNRRTIVLPNPIRVDTKAPTVEVTSIKPTVISPDADGRSDRARISYRVDERAHVSVYVDGTRALRKAGSKPEGTMDWFGKVGGERLPVGSYRVAAVARDLAGNLSARTPATVVVLRYIALGRKRIEVTAGQRFALLVSADANRVEWRLAGRTGSVAPGTIRIRAPRVPGRYTLTLREHGHAVRAAVIVRAAGEERP